LTDKNKTAQIWVSLGFITIKGKELENKRLSFNNTLLFSTRFNSLYTQPTYHACIERESVGSDRASTNHTHGERGKERGQLGSTNERMDGASVSILLFQQGID
jgi:hypothetical protein